MCRSSACERLRHETKEIGLLLAWRGQGSGAYRIQQLAAQYGEIEAKRRKEEPVELQQMQSLMPQAALRRHATLQEPSSKSKHTRPC